MYRVLLVEDEEMILKNLQFMIDWDGLDCVVIATAENGRDGAQKILSYRPDLVITDIRMPYVGGLEMVEQTRDQVIYETILLTGYGEFSYAKKAIALDVFQYLLKPVDPDELRQAVEKARQRVDERKRVREWESSGQEPRPLLQLPQEETRPASRTERMIRYIQENYQKKITIQQLSEEMDLSVSYLHSKFKASTGYTFNDFLNRYRVQQAVRYMRESNMKIYEIAEAVGIPDYKYFNLVFKKYIGVSPSQFLRGRE